MYMYTSTENDVQLGNQSILVTNGQHSSCSELFSNYSQVGFNDFQGVELMELRGRVLPSAG